MLMKKAHEGQRDVSENKDSKKENGSLRDKNLLFLL